MADTSSAFSFGRALLVTELPEDDTYTILATRADGRAGDSQGEFNLHLINPLTLNSGEALSDTVSSEGSNYYVVVNDGTDLVLSYEKQDGEFAPQISVNRVNDDAGLTPVVSLSGDELEQGRMNIPASRGLYIVTVGESLFDFNFREVTAEYELQLDAS